MIDKSVTSWLRAKRRYFIAISLIVITFIIGILIRVTGLVTGTWVLVLIGVSGVAICVLGLWIIWYLLKMVEPKGTRKKRK